MAECDPTSFPAQCFQIWGGRLHEDDGSWGYLTYDLRVRMRLKERLDAYERGLIVAALNEASGNRTHAARALGLNRGTLHSKLHKYGRAAAHDEEAAHP